MEEFKKLLSDIPSGQHHCALSVDEMKIKSGLVFDKHRGALVGFTDLGSANMDIELVMSGTQQDDETVRGKPANHVLAFLARAVFKPSLSLPIAHYFSLNVKGIIILTVAIIAAWILLFAGHQLFPITWEVIEALEFYDIPVVSLTSDGAKANRRLYRMCQDKCGRKLLPYKTTNPYNSSNNLFFFCDAPHLLKTTRNCFSNSFAHSKSRKMQV